MKKSILSLVALLIATMSYAQTAENPSAQTIETPVCYAYLPIQKFTLKYKFSYCEDKFYTNLRFIKGSDNIFRAGDKIIFRTKEKQQVTYSLKESQLAEPISEYIPFETSYEELAYIQKGICEIMFVRDGKRFILEPINDKFAETKKNVKKLSVTANELEYQRNFYTKGISISKEIH